MKYTVLYSEDVPDEILRSSSEVKEEYWAKRIETLSKVFDFIESLPIDQSDIVINKKIERLSKKIASMKKSLRGPSLFSNMCNELRELRRRIGILCSELVKAKISGSANYDEISNMLVVQKGLYAASLAELRRYCDNQGIKIPRKIKEELCL